MSDAGCTSKRVYEPSAAVVAMSSPADTDTSAIGAPVSSVTKPPIRPWGSRGVTAALSPLSGVSLSLLHAGTSKRGNKINLFMFLPYFYWLFDIVIFGYVMARQCPEGQSCHQKTHL